MLTRKINSDDMCELANFDDLSDRSKVTLIKLGKLLVKMTRVTDHHLKINLKERSRQLIDRLPPKLLVKIERDHSL